MDRRTFNRLSAVAARATIAEAGELWAQSPAPGGPEVVLEDKELLVAFDRESGALTRLLRKSTKWVVERRPELGVSFRLLAPLPRQRANFVLGHKQTAARVEKVSPTEVQIVWKDPVSEHGGVVPLTLTATATLVNGVLTFNAALVNNSSLIIETIDYPYFGDFTSPTRETPMHTEHLWVGALSGDEIYPHL